MQDCKGLFNQRKHIDFMIVQKYGQLTEQS